MDAHALQMMVRLYRYAQADWKRKMAAHGADSHHTAYYQGRADGMRQTLQMITEGMKQTPNPLPV